MLIGVTSSLEQRFNDRDERALARAISLVEAGEAQGQALLARVRRHPGKARIVGITGSPGSGKSTLTDQLIAAARGRDLRVAVVAVDPTSPFSGGAILGDRIRMTRWHQDPGVYIRSMASRGHLGGIAAATLQVVALLDAFGFDLVLIETVGVGQAEVDIVRVADTTALLLTPNQGDGVQAVKAGIMEIADIFIINKFDLPGGARLKREILAALELTDFPEESWRPPIVEVTALQGLGVEMLMDHIEMHWSFLKASGGLGDRERSRARFEITAIITEEVRRLIIGREDDFVDDVLSGRSTPAEVARRLLMTL